MVRAPFAAAVSAVFGKDVRAELRSRELITTMGLFALLSLLVFSFALELDRAARAEAIGGVLWVTLVFGSILGLNRSMALERENGGFDALMLAPIARSALFVGKWLANLLVTGVVALLMLPLMAVLYNVDTVALSLLLVVVLGTVGFTAVGTVLAAMTIQTRARESLLPIVMLPITLPLLLAAVRATSAILRGEPDSVWTSWALILLVLDVIFLTAAFLTFEFVLEEG
jgi:heme exporter protein B